MNTQARRPIIVPEDLPRRDPGRAFARACYAIARNRCHDEGRFPGAEKIAEQLWPHDRQAIALTRAAVSPASIASSSGVLSPTIVGDFMGSLSPISAASRLISAGIKVDLSGVFSVTVPHRVSNVGATDSVWVVEGGPAPSKQFSLVGATIGPMKKLSSGCVITRELAESGNGEQVVTTLLSEDIALSLDAAVFSATAATSARPAGLMAGVAALTATTGGGENAARGDIALTAGAVAAATGNGDGIALVASPATAIRLASYKAVIGDNLQIWPSIAVASGILIAVQTKAFLSAFGPLPRVYASREATLHLEDTNPAQIGTAGSPNVVAAPSSSLFQVDAIGIRVTLDVAYALREPGSLAWTQAVTW